MVDTPLRTLADRLGVATEYWDWQGRHVEVPTATVVAVLAALGVDAGDDAAAAAALDGLWRREWEQMLPPCVVVRRGGPTTVPVFATAGDAVVAWVDLEDGGAWHGLATDGGSEPDRELDGRWVARTDVTLPADLPLGYHRLQVRAGTGGSEATLVVTPPWLGVPDRVHRGRTWGLATQLYSVRSEGSWGVGDLTDLADLATWAGDVHGAGFVLVNPMHAAEPSPPMEPSPYLPATRRFANPLYLRVEAVPEYALLDDARRAEVDALRAAVQRATVGLDRIERDPAWTAKRAALRLVFAAGRRAARQIAFDAYRDREGEGLVDFATWCALADRHGPDFRTWPEALRHPEGDAVAAFRTGAADDVEFHAWLQWQLDDQLGAAQEATRRAGMPLGVVHDLAVGVSPTGADAWALQDVLARGVTVGAPPDAYNQIGQDWDQPPWRPDQLASLSYAPFRAMVATVLRHAGGVRVDHVIGLFRLWWIPAGGVPTAGTYVRYDHEAMVGILALEAYRAGAVVVGEDLGTVEPWVRDHLRQRGILGTSVLWFEGDYGPGGTGGPLPAERWREYCLASVTTHDLPPTAAYLAGDHIRLRESLGLLTRPVAEEQAEDAAARAAWFAELHRAGLPASDDDEVATVTSLHRYLLRTPARLLTVSLTDAVGDRRTQNQPGTGDEYPNWRVPLSGPDGTPMTLEQVLTDPRAAALLDAVRDS